MEMGMKHLLRSMLVAAACSIPLAQTIACVPDQKPVLVGGFAGVDGCTSTATVKPLKPGATAFLAVRNAPDIRAMLADRLKSGHPVWLCGKVHNRDWIGIVYPNDRNGDLSECEVSNEASEKAVPYRGPCRSGWVARRYLVLSAG